MNTLEEWVAQVCAALGLPADAVDRAVVLDLARDVAHGVARPAAPLTAYLVGLSTGMRGGSAHALDTTVRTVGALLAQWPTPPAAEA